MSNMADGATIPLQCVPVGILPTADIGVTSDIGPELFAISGERVALLAAAAADRPAHLAERVLALAAEAARLCTAFLPMRPALLPTSVAADWMTAQSPDLETSLNLLAGRTEISMTLSSVVPVETMRSGDGEIKRRLAMEHSTQIIKARAWRALSQLGQCLPYPDRIITPFKDTDQLRRTAGARLSLLVAKPEADLALSDLKRLGSALRHVEGFRARFFGPSPAYSFAPLHAEGEAVDLKSMR